MTTFRCFCCSSDFSSLRVNVSQSVQINKAWHIIKQKQSTKKVSAQLTEQFSNPVVEQRSASLHCHQFSINTHLEGPFIIRLQDITGNKARLPFMVPDLPPLLRLVQQLWVDVAQTRGCELLVKTADEGVVSVDWYSPPLFLLFWCWALGCFSKWSHIRHAWSAALAPLTCRTHRRTSETVKFETYISTFKHLGVPCIVRRMCWSPLFHLPWWILDVMGHLTGCRLGFSGLRCYVRRLPAVQEFQRVCWDVLVISRPFCAGHIVKIMTYYPDTHQMA